MESEITSVVEIPVDKMKDDDSVHETCYDEKEPWVYRSKKLLPGAPSTIELKKKFPFLAIGRFLPIIDFLSDVGSAGSS